MADEKGSINTPKGRVFHVSAALEGGKGHEGRTSTESATQTFLDRVILSRLYRPTDILIVLVKVAKYPPYQK